MLADLFGRIRELVSSASIEQAQVRMRYAEDLRAAA